MPTPCEQCSGVGFLLVENPKTGVTGAKPCVCRAKVQADREAQQAKVNRGTPMTADAAMGTVRSLSGLSFFPSQHNPEARAVIADVVLRMCHTVEQAQFLARKAYELYSGTGGGWERCGIPGLRQILSGLTMPADGLVLHSTAAFPEGLPMRKQLEPAPLLLPPGCEAGAPLPDFDGPRAKFGVLAPAAAAVPRALAEYVGAEDLVEPPALKLVPKAEPLSPERRAELEEQFRQAEEKYRGRPVARKAAG